MLFLPSRMGRTSTTPPSDSPETSRHHLGSVLRPTLETVIVSKFFNCLILTTPKTFPAVQAFIASAITNRDVAAVGTGRRVLLKMSDGLAQRLNGASRGSRFMRVAIAGGTGGFHVEQVGVFGNGQLR